MKWRVLFALTPILFVSACSKRPLPKEAEQPPLHLEELALNLNQQELWDMAVKVEEDKEQYSDDYTGCDASPIVDRREMARMVFEIENMIAASRKAQRKELEESLDGADEGNEDVDDDSSMRELGDDTNIFYTPVSSFIDDAQGVSLFEKSFRGWSDAVEWLQESYVYIKDGKVDPVYFGTMDWFVNGVKRLISQDYYRLYNYSNYYSTYDEMNEFQNAQKLIGDYITLELYKEEQSFHSYLKEHNFEAFTELSRHRYFNTMEYWISLRDGTDEELVYLEFLQRYFERGLEKLQGWKSDSVRAVSENEYDVFVDQNDFLGQEAQLIDWVEKSWNSHSGFRVNLRFQDNEAGSGMKDEGFSPMKFIYAFDDFSVTSYVSPWESEMKLVAGFSVGTYIHEMGHVIGLPDMYYTTWNAETCKYETYFDYDNVMSSHWVRKVYPDVLKKMMENIYFDKGHDLESLVSVREAPEAEEAE